MATLKETKDRISSVKTTLKTTSAMKMVASARLHKGQTMIENMRPYEKRLANMLASALQCVPDSEELNALCRRRVVDEDSFDAAAPEKVAIIAISSNSSLCGAFNSNVIKEVGARVNELKAEGAEVTVFPVGRKMAEAMKKIGCTTPEDLNSLIAHPEYEPVADFAQRLTDAFLEGLYDRIEIIHNHFVSTATQKVVTDTFLPMERPQDDTASVYSDDYIMEPTATELISSLLPRVLRLKVYTAVLDSNAAEHAARTVAMQTATDNGEALLQELTLEYNKGRQQKITSEILDIVGGSMS